MALLIIAKGMALANAILKDTPPKYWKAQASAILKTSNGTNAKKEDLWITVSLDLLISNSNEPSNTIKIKPIVPKIGKIGFRFGIFNWKKVLACLVKKPNANNKITEGIFVFDDVRSKT